MALTKWDSSVGGVVEMTPEEEAAFLAGQQTPVDTAAAAANAAALEERRRDETKDEILELAEKGDLASVVTALKKALELIA